MNPSLSVVLPVYNAQTLLVGHVEELLELLPELTDHFEILIVDDGSTDGTEELACDLACQYPQVRVSRVANHQGPAAALQTGLDQTRGEIVFVQDAEAPIGANELRRLWKMRNDQQLVIARDQPKPLSYDLTRRLVCWAEALRQCADPTAPRGTRMIRRAALEGLKGPTIRRASRNACVAPASASRRQSTSS